MIKVKRLEMWNLSVSMMIGKSPQIKYKCGRCGSYNKTRISMEAIKRRKSYVVCSYCGEINDTGLILG